MSETTPDVLDRTITARFYVSEVAKQPGGNAKITLQPAYAGGANRDWSTASPSGKIELFVTNPVAVAFYEAALGLPQIECIEVAFSVVPSQLPTPEPLSAG